MKFTKPNLGKDNLLNLKFWAGMTFGMILTDCLSGYATLSRILFWATILLVPYFTKKAAKITFDKEQGFFNSEGKSLADSYPRHFMLVIFANFGLLAGIGLVVDEFFPSMSQFTFNVMTSSIMFILPVLYFMRKNCPIAILFDRHALFGNVPGIEYRTYNATFHKKHSASYVSPSRSSAKMAKEWRTSPGYSSLSGNIHHRN